MLIAVSGTHSMGKSTMVDDFLATHPEYTHEIEPYRALRDDYDIKFAEQSTQHCANVQLEYTIERMKRYNKGDNAIFDRCAADFIPYCQYTAKFKLTDIDEAYLLSLAEEIKENLHHLDLIIFLPITEKHLVELEDDGIRPVEIEYRNDVDQYFKEMYRNKSFDILPDKDAPKILELWGSREERIERLDAVIAEMENK